MHKKYKKYLLGIALFHVFLRIKFNSLHKDASLTLSMTCSCHSKSGSSKNLFPFLLSSGIMFFPRHSEATPKSLVSDSTSPEMTKEREKKLFSLFCFKYISAYSMVKSGEPNMPSISSKIADGFLALPLAERCCCRSSSSDE